MEYFAHLLTWLVLYPFSFLFIGFLKIHNNKLSDTAWIKRIAIFSAVFFVYLYCTVDHESMIRYYKEDTPKPLPTKGVIFILLLYIGLYLYANGALLKSNISKTKRGFFFISTHTILFSCLFFALTVDQNSTYYILHDKCIPTNDYDFHCIARSVIPSINSSIFLIFGFLSILFSGILFLYALWMFIKFAYIRLKHKDSGLTLRSPILLLLYALTLFTFNPNNFSFNKYIITPLLVTPP